MVNAQLFLSLLLLFFLLSSSLLLLLFLLPSLFAIHFARLFLLLFVVWCFMLLFFSAPVAFVSFVTTAMCIFCGSLFNLLDCFYYCFVWCFMLLFFFWPLLHFVPLYYRGFFCLLMLSSSSAPPVAFVVKQLELHPSTAVRSRFFLSETHLLYHSRVVYCSLFVPSSSCA